MAPDIAIKNYSLSIYTNGVVIGLAELLGNILCYFIIDHYPRKKIMYISQAICLLTSLPVFIFFSCSKGSCSAQTQILQTVGLALFRFAAIITYGFFYMQQSEALPNQIRGLALQFISLPSYFAPVSVPQIITFCERKDLSIVVFFAACTVIVAVLITYLPETYGLLPQEMIEELKYEHVDVNDPKQ